MRFQLVESIGSDYLSFDNYTKRYWEKNSFRKGYVAQKVDINAVLDSTQPRKDNSVLSRREGTWGSDYDKYTIDSNLLLTWQYYPIVIDKYSNGTYRVRDGNHRLIALQNDGYRYVDALVKEIENEI